jgi:hypothetical protein
MAQRKNHPFGWFLQNSAPCYFPAKAVYSPLLGLTAVFGMGTGITLALWAPMRRLERILRPSSMSLLVSTKNNTSRMSYLDKRMVLLAPITSQLPPCISQTSIGLLMQGHKKSMDLLVHLSSICCHTYTWCLSTRSSFWGLIGKSNLEVSFALNMLSALIWSAHSYPAMLLVEQLVHQRCVHSGPLVLRANPLKFPSVHSGYKPNCLTRVILDCSCPKLLLYY